MKPIPQEAIDRLHIGDPIFWWLSPIGTPPDIATWFIDRSIQEATKWGPCHVGMFMGGHRYWEMTIPHAQVADLRTTDLEWQDVEFGVFPAVRAALQIIENIERLTRFWDDLIAFKVPYDIGELFAHLWHRLGLAASPGSDPKRTVCSTTYVAAALVIDVLLCPDHPPDLVDPGDLIMREPTYRWTWRSGISPWLHQVKNGFQIVENVEVGHA